MRLRHLLVAATTLALVLAGCGSAVEPDQPVAASQPGTSRPPGPARGYVPGVRVAAAGDIACAPGARVTAATCRQAATARLVRSLDPKWVLALGDQQYQRGAWSDFMGSYDKSWGSFRAKTKPVLGNHEYLTAGAKGYNTYFGRKAPGYSAITIGTWRVYLLNSNCQAVNCAAEKKWLARGLSAQQRACTAIVMHHPRYSSGLEHGSNKGMARLWDVAYAHHVDLALAGHDHDYERFAPMDGRGHVRSRTGITSFVVGTGGKSLYHKGRSAPGTRYFRADAFGVLMLSLGTGAFSWNFRTIGGQVRDLGSRNCR